MTAPKKRVAAPERRARILEVARATFLERGEGINGVSMRLIAERGGIDEALIYRHFGSKENLYSEVVIAEVKVAVERLLDRTRALSVGELSAERERREWQLTHEFVLVLLALPPEVLRAMGSLLCGERSHGAEFYRSALAPAVRSVEEVVEGELRNWAHPEFSPALAVRVTIATCLWHVLECDLTEGSGPSADFARELTDLVFYGITATGSRVR
jgi:AcrR family transcriptional regulator